MADMNAEIQALIAELAKEKAERAKEKARADEEKARADEEKARADEEKARADEEKARADEEKARADKEKARADEEEAERAKDQAKLSGEYWDTFEKVWEFEPAEYKGCFSRALKFRSENPCELYRGKIVQILEDDRNVEVLLQDRTAPSVFEADDETTVRSYQSNNGGNRRDKKNHEKSHAKNFLGQTLANNEKTRAHTFPNDLVCYRWWWPMYQLVTGTQDSTCNLNAIQKLGSMRTSKFIFGGEHNHIYDSLEHGVVCTIPIFESIVDMAKWQYGDRYKMLIVADSAETYRKLHMNQDSTYGHIDTATPEEVAKATKLLADITKVMADSLVSNWEDHYHEIQEQGGRKEMLTSMKEMLVADETIDIPIFRDRDGQNPKLYTFDYAALYENNSEGAKYVIDPLPAAIKSGMNLSFVTTAKKYPDKRGCKLLPGCPGSVSSSGEEESVGSVDILDVLDREENKALATSFEVLFGKEIELRVVSDNEFDDDDDDDDDLTVYSELGIKGILG